jgi:hypothetical protein
MNTSVGSKAVLVLVAVLAGCRVEARPVQGDSARPAPLDAAAPMERSCGGIAGFQCPAGTYCAYGIFQKCGAGDAMASCKPRPEFCTEQYKPVCGCDHKEYGNACVAARAGTSVFQEGGCK